MGGHGSGDYGLGTLLEIVADLRRSRRARETADPDYIGKTSDDKDRSIYEAVPGYWVDRSREGS